LFSLIHCEISEEFVFTLFNILIVGAISYFVYGKIPIETPDIIRVRFFNIVLTGGFLDPIDVNAFE
jgi:hypothetical protein